MLKRAGTRRWLREHRINGRIVDHSILTVSADGALLTITGEHPGTAPETLRRIGHGRGLAGRWRSTRLGINVSPTLVIARLPSGRLRWGAPADGNFYEVGVNGPPAINQGPTSTPIATLQVSQVATDRLRWVERLRGTTNRIGLDRLSSDGNTLVEVAWPATMPQERQTLVYRRAPMPARDPAQHR